MGWSSMKPWAKREFLIVSLVVIAFVALIVVLIMFNKPGEPAGPVCNSPYILVGTECCLDQNSNKICDADETTESASEITGGAVTEIEEIEEIEALGPVFEPHILLNGQVQDRAELTYIASGPMPGLKISIKNLEKSDIRCDIDPYYGGDLIENRVSRNVKVKTYEPESIIINSVSSEYGESYKAEFKVSCWFEDSPDAVTKDSIYFNAKFTDNEE